MDNLSSEILTRFAVHVDFGIASLDNSLGGNVEERVVQVGDLAPGNIPKKPLFTMSSCKKKTSPIQRDSTPPCLNLDDSPHPV